MGFGLAAVLRWLVVPIALFAALLSATTAPAYAALSAECTRLNALSASAANDTVVMAPPSPGLAPDEEIVFELLSPDPDGEVVLSGLYRAELYVHYFAGTYYSDDEFPFVMSSALYANDGFLIANMISTPNRGISFSCVKKAAASNNTTLQDLQVNGVSLQPTDPRYPSNYSVSVTQASVQVAVQTADAGARVTISGTDTATATMSLEMGANTVSVVVTAADGITAETYTLTIEREAPTAPEIASVSPSFGPTEGGNSVKITIGNLPAGSRFTPSSVSFGGVKTSDYVGYDSTVVAAAPAHAAGTVDVEVVASVNGIEMTMRSSAAYTYVRELTAEGYSVKLKPSEHTEGHLYRPAAFSDSAVSARIVEGPVNGVATVESGGIRYVPDTGFAGIDRFQYVLTGYGRESAPATAEINVIAPIRIPVGALPLGRVGETYRADLSASGGVAPYSYAIESGVLPPGLELVNGVVEGTPTALGRFSVTMKTTDSEGDSISTRHSLQVWPQLPVPQDDTVDIDLSAGAAEVELQLNIQGGPVTSLTVIGSPTNGTVRVAGTRIYFTPNASATGVDYIRYMAEGPGGISAVATITINFGKATPTLQLSAGQSSFAVGNSITLTATLDSRAQTSGEVVFVNGTDQLGTANLANGVAALVVGQLPVGTHTLTAMYAGDVNNTDVTSAPVTVDVRKRTPQIWVSEITLEPRYGGDLEISLTISGAYLPESVELRVDGVLYGTVPFDGEVAHDTLQNLQAGMRYIEFVYNGDANNEGFSTTPIVVVIEKATPVVEVEASAASVTWGDAVTLTARLPQAVAPTGQVVFFAGDTRLGDATIADGVAALTTSALPLGTQSIIAEYLGDGNHEQSISQATNVVVLRPILKVGLWTSSQTPMVNEMIQLDVFVTDATGALITDAFGANGMVSFWADQDLLGTVNIKNGGAQLQTDQLAVGRRELRAEYIDQSNNVRETSDVILVTVQQAAPGLTLVASDLSPMVAADVTLTATLSGGVSASGAVTFLADGVALGSAPLSGGAAVFSTAGLSAGARVITAEYAGDANNAAAMAPPVTVTVQQATPGLTLVASDLSPMVAADVTLTATLTGGVSASGAVTFLADGVALGSAPLSGGAAVFSTAGLGAGARVITAEYAGDANNAAVTAAAVTVTVQQAAPVLTLAASDLSPMVAADVTLTATLSGGVSATGAVTFLADGVALGSAPLSGGAAVFSTAGLGAGARVITAEYVGDANNAAVTAAAVTVTVQQAAPVLTLAASDLSPMVAADVTLTATLSGGVSASGAVTFLADGVALGSAPLSGGAAVFSTAGLSVGARVITAEYAGDANNAAVTAAPVTVTVQQAAPGLTLVTSDLSPMVAADVTLTATLSGGVSASGAVTFLADGVALGSAPLSGGAAVFSTAGLSAGARVITAEYAGDANNAAVTAAAVTVTVQQAAPVLTLLASDLSPMVAADVTLTATLSGGVSASGAVTFLADGVALGSAPLSGGAAVFSTAGLGVGARVITAEYAGDANNAAAQARAVTVTVMAPDFTFAPVAGALEGATAHTPYSQLIAASGGTGPYSYAVTQGALPAGMVLDADGRIWGTPTAPENASFTITATDANGSLGSAAYTIAVAQHFDAAEVAAEVQGLVRGFTQSRQSLVASAVRVPNLVERRRMLAANEPFTTRLSTSGDGVSLKFATSFLQISASEANRDNILLAPSTPFNIWVDGSVAVHNRDQNGSRWGHFSVMSFGADYLATPAVLLGFSLHYDDISDPTSAFDSVDGRGWLAGPYASFELGRGVFWDTSILYGTTSNTVETAQWWGDFDTTRAMVDTSVSGTWALGTQTALTPRARAVYLYESGDDYSVTNRYGDIVPVGGITSKQLRVSLGAEMQRRFALDDGAEVSTTVGVSGGFSGLDGAGAFGEVTSAATYRATNNWVYSGGLSLNIEGDGLSFATGRIGASIAF